MQTPRLLQESQGKGMHFKAKAGCSGDRTGGGESRASLLATPADMEWGGALLRGSFHPSLQFLPVTPQDRLYKGFLSEYKEKRGEEEGAEEETNKGGKRMTSGAGGTVGKWGRGNQILPNKKRVVLTL